MLNFRPFFSLHLYVYEFWSFARPIAYENFAFGNKMLAFLKKSKLISIYDIWGCIENWQGNYFLMFFTIDVGDFTCSAGFFSFMWEISHACRKSGKIVSRRETPSQCGRVGSPGSALNNNYWAVDRKSTERTEEIEIFGKIFSGITKTYSTYGSFERGLFSLLRDVSWPIVSVFKSILVQCQCTHVSPFERSNRKNKTKQNETKK